ncbi:MAG: hypothetical protein AAF721_28485 [Myxococcota bacterium]
MAGREPGPDADEQGSRRFGELIDEAANRGELEAALRLTDEAQRLYPHHRWHFWRASLLGELDDCEAAIPEYEAYLAEETDPANRQSAEAALDACRADVTPPEPVPPPDPTPQEAVDSPLAPPEMPAPSPARPWHRDPVGVSLVSVGLVGVGASAVLLIQARRGRDRAETAGDLQGFDDRFRRARGLNVGGYATLGVGAALIVGGVLSFVVAARRGDAALEARAWPGLTFRFGP